MCTHSFFFRLSMAVWIIRLITSPLLFREIVDASAATQLNNLRTILMDTANSASGMNLFH